jgi:hypothetical protein
MRFYKINPPMANIVRRELRREMQAGVGKTDDFSSGQMSISVPGRRAPAMSPPPMRDGSTATS